jgi:hypothetical protein
MGVKYVPDQHSGSRYDEPMTAIALPNRATALSANDAGSPMPADRNFLPGKRGI